MSQVIDSSHPPHPPGAAVTIRTGARLHFGPLSFRPARGRHFGGIGLMVREPHLELTATRLHAGPDEIQATTELQSDIARILSTIRGRVDSQLPVRVDVRNAPPRHSGLGSGTQLSLALAEALMWLSGSTVSAEEIAGLTGRGRRSGIGIAGYGQGGFLVDAGHRTADSPAELAVRSPFSEHWPLLLVTPRGEQGCHGAAEESHFQQLPPFDGSRTGELCRLVLTELLPALAAQDFDSFAAALTAYGHIVGDYFAPLQGGRIGSPQLREVLGRLADGVPRAIVQSSWGPTVAVICGDESSSTATLAELLNLAPAGSLRIIRTAALNTGREVSCATVGSR